MITFEPETPAGHPSIKILRL